MTISTNIIEGPDLTKELKVGSETRSTLRVVVVIESRCGGDDDLTKTRAWLCCGGGS